jgi:CRISPR/Cas system-associated endonuclease Cas3-HD
MKEDYMERVLKMLTNRDMMISGCKKDDNEKKIICIERYKDHVGIMFKTLDLLFNTYTVYVNKEYIRYIKDLYYLSGRENLIREYETTVDCVKLAIFFHDIGKCLGKNQRSLRNSCAAPYHEISSAIFLSIYLEYVFNNLFMSKNLLIENKDLLKISIPLILAILLHHHAMRNIKDLGKALDDEIKNLRISFETDINNITKCLEETLRFYTSVYMSEFIIFLKNLDVKDIDRSSAVLKLLIKMYDKIFDNERLWSNAYKVSILINSIISVVDNISAHLNREICIDPEKIYSMSNEEFIGYIINIIERRKGLQEFVRIFTLREINRKYIKNILNKDLR